MRSGIRHLEVVTPGLVPRHPTTSGTGTNACIDVSPKV